MKKDIILLALKDLKESKEYVERFIGDGDYLFDLVAKRLIEALDGEEMSQFESEFMEDCSTYFLGKN